MASVVGVFGQAEIKKLIRHRAIGEFWKEPADGLLNVGVGKIIPAGSLPGLRGIGAEDYERAVVTNVR
jgi:hypothetical protein